MRIVRALVVAAVALLVSAQVFAQTTRPERPYRGLFGGGYGDAEQMLSLSASFGGGYDGNILFGNPSANGVGGVTVDPHRAVASTIANGGARLNYILSTNRLSFSAFGSGSATDYPALPKSIYPGYGAGTGGAVKFSQRTSLSFGGSLAYQPYFTLPGGAAVFDTGTLVVQKAAFSKLNESLAQDLGAPAAISLSPTAAPQQTSTTNALEGYSTWYSSLGFSHQLARRVSLSLGGVYSRNFSTSGSRDMTFRSVGATVSIAIAKGLALRLGDGVSEAKYVTGAPVRSQNIEADLDFSRGLTMSLSKRMTLSFGTGSSIVSTTFPTKRTELLITGNASLVREIGRSWQTSVNFTRSAGFMYGFLQPVVSNTFSVNLGGLVSRRVQFHSAVGGWWGAVGLSAVNNNFRTYTAGAGISWAFTRELALSLDYTYYRYTFDSGIDLPAGLGRAVNRQSVHAAINLWEPLFHRSRRPNAAR